MEALLALKRNKEALRAVNSAKIVAHVASRMKSKSDVKTNAEMEEVMRERAAKELAADLAERQEMLANWARIEAEDAARGLRNLSSAPQPSGELGCDQAVDGICEWCIQEDTAE